MLTKVKTTIEKYRLFKPGNHILVACSGGPDSLALLHVLSCLQSEYKIELSVAHFNHMFRGAEADADAVFVGRFCADLGLDYYQTSIDVPLYIKNSGHSAEDAARILRYRFLRRLAKRLDAIIATAHHQDDQAETVLLHMLRGAGSLGLAGMKPLSGDIIRPFLEVARSDIEVYCQDNNLTPCLDKSNLTTDYLRNYLRIELMPILKNKFNKNLPVTLCRTAQLVSDEHEFIANEALSLWDSVISEFEGDSRLDCRNFNNLHIAIQREIIRQFIKKKRGDLKGINFIHVEKFIDMAAKGSVGSLLELPGRLLARRSYDYISLKMAPPANNNETGFILNDVELNIPGFTNIPELGISVDAALLKERSADNNETAVFDWEQLNTPLIVRTRKAGDRFYPVGAEGGKKLKEFLIDAKIPREKRDKIPVFCDAQGIIWIGGYRKAKRAIPNSDTKRYLQLKIKAGGFSSD